METLKLQPPFVTWTNRSNLLPKAVSLMREASHNLFLVQRVGVETFLELSVEPITDSVRRWLTIRFMEEEWKKQTRAYQHLEIMGLRHMTGILFEAKARLALQLR